MNRTFPFFIETVSLRALLLRELRAALINRYFQVFAALSLLSGIATSFFSENADAIGFFVVQVALFPVSLFALLAGVSSAQAEREEWQLMFSQPVPRAAYVIGKFIAYLSIFAAVLALLFVPALFSGAPVQRLALLYFQTLLLGAAFLALGLAVGFLAHDGAQALIIGATAWLFLLFGVDLVGLFTARFELMQKMPDLWVSVLMLNPLDAFRIHALFALEQIPAEAANKTPLANWWITHAGFWFCAVAILWCVSLTAFTGFRLSKFEE
ncbi:MAG TPA: ABC transporter permease [Candidatus Udaeobacter sp.]|jgi:ABC-type transport system involved in multi-copper enzyme maturation permease subunit